MQKVGVQLCHEGRVEDVGLEGVALPPGMIRAYSKTCGTETRTFIWWSKPATNATEDPAETAASEFPPSAAATADSKPSGGRAVTPLM